MKYLVLICLLLNIGCGQLGEGLPPPEEGLGVIFSGTYKVWSQDGDCTSELLPEYIELSFSDDLEATDFDILSEGDFQGIQSEVYSGKKYSGIGQTGAIEYECEGELYYDTPDYPNVPPIIITSCVITTGTSESCTDFDFRLYKCRADYLIHCDEEHSIE